MTERLKTLYENYFIKTHVKELKPLKSSLQIKIVTELLHPVRMMLSKLSNYFKNPNNMDLSLPLCCAGSLLLAVAVWNFISLGVNILLTGDEFLQH